MPTVIRELTEQEIIERRRAAFLAYWEPWLAKHYDRLKAKGFPADNSEFGKSIFDAFTTGYEAGVADKRRRYKEPKEYDDMYSNV